MPAARHPIPNGDFEVSGPEFPRSGGPAAETDGEPASHEQPVEHHCQICPTCGTRLSGHRCKLICAQCGYYLSCADYY